MANKDELKGFVAGLGLGSVLAGLGVYLINPDNREDLKNKAKEFKSNIGEMLNGLQKEIEEAKKTGQKKLIEELELAQETLRKAEKQI
jgi:hypothetical protein